MYFPPDSIIENAFNHPSHVSNVKVLVPIFFPLVFTRLLACHVDHFDDMAFGCEPSSYDG